MREEYIGITLAVTLGQMQCESLEQRPSLQPYKLNLQTFADGSKTEQATPKRKEDARKKGQMLRSPEISSAIVLALTFFGFKVFGGYIYDNIAQYTKTVLESYMRTKDITTGTTLYTFFIETLILFAKVIAPIMGTALVAGLAVNYAQVGFVFTTETISFNIERIINPINGLKRMFSARAAADLAKSIVKIVIVILVVYQYIKGQINDILNVMGLDIVNIFSFFGTLAFNVGIRISITFIILGLFDYLFQWWQYEKDLRMSKQEVKDEYKETEGNPQVKSKIKEKQRAMSMRRMMQEVPKADVIITNPTHFAVAIKYDTAVNAAPMVIAKGQDFIAQRIKEIARENKVEIVENKPLARTLFATVDIGEVIPQDLYQAVAEVLAFVFSLKEGR